jgi:hypothetical protein
MVGASDSALPDGDIESAGCLAVLFHYDSDALVGLELECTLYRKTR